MSVLKIRFVVATRANRSDFFKNTATGRSIGLYQFPFIELDLYDSNKEGLPVVYNRSIEKAKTDPAILLFIHDDVYLIDFYWFSSLATALKRFDVIGVAGNKRRLPNQPSWVFVDSKPSWDKLENLSGVVGHGNGFPPTNLSIYGNPCQEVKLLDGMLLASKSETLHQKNIRFDERFDFHFYDLDFCRTAEQAGLTMGTWNLSVIHESDGNFGSPQWTTAKKKYFDKWGE